MINNRQSRILVLGALGALIAAFVVHEAFPRRSSSLQEWLAAITRTRPGEILASSESHGHYIAIQQTSDACAIVWIRHPSQVGDTRSLTTSMESPLGSVYDDSRPEGIEVIRLSPSWFNGDARDGEGTATPIKMSVKGDIELSIAETIGCTDRLAYRATVAWR